VKTTPKSSVSASPSPLRIRFDEKAQLTSYAGLVLFQQLFVSLKLDERLRDVFAELPEKGGYDADRLLKLLVIHLLLGWRRLRGLDYYRDDPLVQRVVGLTKLPSVATLSRFLARTNEELIGRMRSMVRTLVLERLKAEGLRRVTLDFDGSIQSTKGRVEGTAVGFNKKKKGARSYYPLYATVAQTSSLLDVLHRPGNVHDSVDAGPFIEHSIDAVREHLGAGVEVEVRMDSAFFGERILSLLQRKEVSYTCSVPFERFAALKLAAHEVRVWKRINEQWSYAEVDFLPKSWEGAELEGRVRFVVFRQQAPKQRKGKVPGPQQLDIFLPEGLDYSYKAIVTNRFADAAATVLKFHHGRGSQEKLFGEGNQHVGLNVVATRSLHANQLFTLTAMLAHNLGRELQMSRQAPSKKRRLQRTRPALWAFQELGTLRMRLIHRAGMLVRPQGRDTLVVSASERTKQTFERHLEPMRNAA
jgi:hypothetical protein